MCKGKLLGSIVLLLLPLLCQAQEHKVVSCNPPDNLTTVQGGKECLALNTYIGDGTKSVSALVVFLHSDASSGSAVHYMYPYAKKIATRGIVTAVLLRPGYFAEGRKSSGSDGSRRDNYTAENIDTIASAVRTLKQQHKPARTILVAHSGGAAIAGVILGKHPGVADGALLLGCQCNAVPGWTRSLYPPDFVNDVPKGTRVIAQTGTDDPVTPVWSAKSYIESLVKRGIDARFDEIPGGTHASNTLMTTDAFSKAVLELIGVAKM